MVNPPEIEIFYGGFIFFVTLLIECTYNIIKSKAMNKLIKLKDENYIIIDDTELTDAIPGEFYFNTYDNHIWKYMPSPCPLPYWGNITTLRKITHCTYFLNEDIETISFVKYL